MSSIIERAQDAFYALVGSCCKTDATLKLNGRSFKILKLLGEGGFSYVYLAQDQESKRLFALKKIRCPLGSDSVKTALKEVQAYKRFRHPNIIRCLDSCVVQDREGDGKIIYLFLPYYKNATVQHVITSHHVNGTSYPESQILSLFLGTCRAVKAMHQPAAAANDDDDDGGAAPPRSRMRPPSMTGSNSKAKGKGKANNNASSSYPPPADAFELDSEPDDDDDDEDDELRSGEREGEALIGGLEATRAKLAEATRDDAAAEGGIAPSRPELSSSSSSSTAAAAGEPWAHRDIKPANIMISDDGVTPILMDFGSALPARIAIPDRRVALLHQDLAAEHCSMPFRAPELFDVKTDTTLTEKCDVWSLGCTAYAMAYGTSPFETSQESSLGGSVAMAVLNGKYQFPPDQGGAYSTGFKEIVRACLEVNPDRRPDIDEVIRLTESALSRLQ